ncbi:hypothetical protein G1K66_12515 [Tenacibaculum finnmarkense]|uniref:hypothetical protein n=1 Tax=Tenacibaculum finnmarkense TaxID=2781243 RepID=UPI001EFAAADF|nr:hypothetical protein [Tenacibaculum finnmarkense]MCG8750550.1 hypothetical protein [Tenacibaculum finnmarkense]MCG8755551.1 hypothetical protein [Tenacibaculum finnmarkense]MCG8784131.1 hypothetical protein [Tenacibaculum finnmarkense]MCG8796592.1 hypothetical protein [Tenacibaculum finnmarkense]MCG8798962.1 hypothetical protein [Tenacibaculum finnmarkense]
MGIKKIARPINNLKNSFVQLLQNKGATDIDVFEGEGSAEWDYYRTVSAFSGENLITVSFEMWNSKVRISYSDDNTRCPDVTINEFKRMMNNMSHILGN